MYEVCVEDDIIVHVIAMQFHAIDMPCIITYYSNVGV